MSPEQSAKVGSTSPVALMHGAWSTPMNQMSGLALAAAAVAGTRLKPVATMTSKSWSMNAWMSGP